MGNYSKQWSTATPGCLIFLIDQSSSMSRTWTTDGKSFAEYTSDVINQTINELIATNAAGETVKDRVFISLIGYGIDGANNIRSEYLARFAEKPLRVDIKEKRVHDGDGGWITITVKKPIFIEPKSDGFTPMSDAFEAANQLIEGWIQKKNDNPVPVIINVTDGHPESNIPEKTPAEIERTVLIANKIMNLATLDGNPLIFNVHIAKNENEIQFSEYAYELNGDKKAELLLSISSKVPDTYKKIAKDIGLSNIKTNARGLFQMLRQLH